MAVSDHDRLSSSAVCAEADTSLVAHALAGYRRCNGLDARALAAWLGCEPESLPSLALCRRPVATLPSFQADVERLARVAGCDPTRLEELLWEPGPSCPR
jgi:hypothetical protein